MSRPEADPTESRRTEVVSAKLRPEDIARLDHAAQRRGMMRDEMVAEAIDAFLAREMWSGGFTSPPPMEIPAPAQPHDRPRRRPRRR